MTDTAIQALHRNVGNEPTPAGKPGMHKPFAAKSQTVLLAIGNMHCSACVNKIKTALLPFGDGVQMQAETATRTLSLTWKTQTESVDDLSTGNPLNAFIQAISEAGFPAQLLNISDDSNTPKPSLQRIGVAVLFTMQTMMLALAGYLGADQSDDLVRMVMHHAQWIVATPVVLYSGWPFLYGAWRDISSRQVTMDLPVGIAIAAAYSFSAVNVMRGQGVLWFDSATMFVTLLLIARQVESAGRTRATAHLKTLFSQQKNTARRLNGDGSSKEVATSLIAIDDLVEAHPSESLPVDGIALNAALVSEAVLTGEAIAKSKAVGDKLFAGSILLGNEPLRIRTTASGHNTSLGRITQLMHQALTSRPRVQQLADKVASYFVATVLALAAIGGIAWSFKDPEMGFNVALTVLVASCPCALSLATPAALAASVSRMARRGMMVLKLDGLMHGSKIDHVVFDKTGTLTSEELQIQDVYSNGAIETEQALGIAAGLEQISRHPIASAFNAISPVAVTQPTVQSSSVSGLVMGKHYLLRASSEQELATFAVKANAASTHLSLCKEGVAQAVICLLAPLREEAFKTVAALKQQHIHVSLYSGDHTNSVAAIAQQLGIDNYAGSLTPAEKLQRIEALQQKGYRVAAVGDGVNDAPLLAAADVGMAMGSGTAQAQSGADITLTNNHLSSITSVFDESKILQRRIRQNISWAIAYNLTVFPLALSGTLAPWAAAIGMASSSLIVVGNAMRGSKSEPIKETPCQP